MNLSCHSVETLISQKSRPEVPEVRDSLRNTECLEQSWSCHHVPSVPSLVCFVHLLAKPIPQFLRIEAGEIEESELFASQSGITTPPSDALSANESEPDGQIFLKQRV